MFLHIFHDHRLGNGLFKFLLFLAARRELLVQLQNFRNETSPVVLGQFRLLVARALFAGLEEYALDVGWNLTQFEQLL